MKYPTRIYAEGLAEAIASGRDAAAIRRNFMALLDRYGDGVHLPKIIEETERLLRRRDGSKKVVVSFARPQPKSARALTGPLVGPQDALEEVIDPTLVAGMKIVVNDERAFDASLRTKLDAMLKP